MSKTLNLSDAEAEALVAILKELIKHWEYSDSHKFARVIASSIARAVLKKLGHDGAK